MLMGCATMIFLNIDSLLGRIESEKCCNGFVQDDTTDKELHDMERSLNKISNVDEVEFGCEKKPLIQSSLKQWMMLQELSLRK